MVIIEGSLLSIAGKVIARIILNRLLVLAEKILPESHCGFRSARGTIDMIFCACQLQEKAREQQKPLYLIFYDPEKAFDSVPRDAAWAVMKCFGLPDQIIAMLRALHDGMASTCHPPK